MIELQQQPHDDACISACLAMLMGRPVEEVVEEFHHSHFTGLLTITEYLHRNFITCSQMIAEPQTLLVGKAYLLAVPSLNYPGLNHCIILIIDDWNNEFIFDPNQGREGKKHYVAHDKDVVLHDELRLRSWIATHEVTL